MGGVIGYLAHLGIVRVLSVPVMMAGAIYILYLLAAPPPDIDEEDGAAKP